MWYTEVTVKTVNSNVTGISSMKPFGKWASDAARMSSPQAPILRQQFSRIRILSIAQFHTKSKRHTRAH